MPRTSHENVRVHKDVPDASQVGSVETKLYKIPPDRKCMTAAVQTV